MLINISPAYHQDGFSIVQDFFSLKEADEIISQLEQHAALDYETTTNTDYNLINSIPFIHNLAYAERLISKVKELIGNSAIPVNAFVIDKTQDSNWGLDWHQDLRIAVKQKIETPGYCNWTVEAGIPHTIPPKEILEKKLAVRIHLDPCNAENGAMLLVPGSHKNGIIPRAEFENIVSSETVCCAVEKGGLMFMASLLLHQSPYSTTNKKRRVLQIDYVATSLANGLEWDN